MYSLVLLSALAPGQVASPGTPVAGPMLINCLGHGGCTGYSYSCGGYSCTGYGYGGCTGYTAGCYGSCYGARHCIFGHHAGCHGGLFGHRNSCNGCTGCTGYSCSGWSCFGSCTGSCTGYGGPGASWGGPMYYSPNAVYGNVTNPNPIPVIPPTTTTPPVTPEVKKDAKMGANIKFQLPADAKLFVDGRLTNLTGTERAFVTPSLGAGRFFYEVKAELMIDGQVVVEQKRVIVEAGTNLVESFPKLFAAIGAKGDAVAGK